MRALEVAQRQSIAWERRMTGCSSSYIECPAPEEQEPLGVAAEAGLPAVPVSHAPPATLWLLVTPPTVRAAETSRCSTARLPFSLLSLFPSFLPSPPFLSEAASALLLHDPLPGGGGLQYVGSRGCVACHVEPRPITERLGGGAALDGDYLRLGALRAGALSRAI